MTEETTTYIDHVMHEAIEHDTEAYFTAGNSIDCFNTYGDYIGTIQAYNTEPVVLKDKAEYYYRKQLKAYNDSLSSILDNELDIDDEVSILVDELILSEVDNEN